MLKQFLGALRSKSAVQGMEAAEEKLSPENQKAIDTGREIASLLDEKITAYVDSRFISIQYNFLTLLQKQIDTTRYQNDHSPLLLARIEYNIFCNQSDDSQQKLLLETVNLFQNKWSEFITIIDPDGNFIKRLAESRIKACFAEFKLSGLEVLSNNVDILKKADDDWRLRFPHLAIKEPSS